MRNKKFIFVNNEWWKVFDIEDFTKPEEDAGLGERLFYTKLKQHSVLCVDKHGNWNHWVYNGSKFTVIADTWPEWRPVDRGQASNLIPEELSVLGEYLKYGGCVYEDWDLDGVLNDKSILLDSAKAKIQSASKASYK